MDWTMTQLFLPCLLLAISMIVNAIGDVPAKAIYFMDNHDQNSIHAIRVGPRGLLEGGTITPTGGLGASCIAAGITPRTFAGPDSIISTGSVRVFGNHLFVVNPGSNSLSMFYIDPTNPLDLTLVGRAVDTQGQFPNSVAVSPYLACVTNIGPISGVACFRISPDIGLSAISSLFPYQLNQTLPPLGFPDGPPIDDQARAIFTSAAFNADFTSLIVTQAGNPLVNISGHLLVYSVDKETANAHPTISVPNNTHVLFSTFNIPGTNNVFVTDPSFGTAIVNVSPVTSVGSTIILTEIQGESALCWAEQSPFTKTVFSTDGLRNRFIEQDVLTGEVLGIVNGTNENLGMIDIIGLDDKMYALSPGLAPGTTAVVVLDVSEGPGKAKIAQNFYPKGFDTPQVRGGFAAAKGMAAWSA